MTSVRREIPFDDDLRQRFADVDSRYLVQRYASHIGNRPFNSRSVSGDPARMVTMKRAK